jgi:tetratricopeptide (TPR) repeat protein
MPGAFAYHLHSYSANSLRTTSQHWAGPLLAKGITATLGTIDEPYLTGTPDMAIFTGRFLLNNFSFGEAAYACQGVLSWQTTVVGDPLYRPFPRNLDLVAREFSQTNNKLLEWCYLRLLNLNEGRGRSLSQLTAMLEQVPITTNSAVLMAKLSDLYGAQGKPASAIHACQQALKLGPSRQQRIGLRLTLGERLSAANRETEAYDDYRSLLEEFPDYAGKHEIYKKLLPLAQKLGKKNDEEMYQAQLKK